MKFTRTITKPNEVVLALPLAGQIIPSYTDRTVYVGNMEFYTQNLSHKMDQTWAFYNGIPVCDAFRFLKGNNITAVFDGFDEKNTGNAVLRYPFLTLAKTFGVTDVFSVDKTFSGCR
jgi:hypothetical protein